MLAPGGPCILALDYFAWRRAGHQQQLSLDLMTWIAFHFCLVLVNLNSWLMCYHILASHPAPTSLLSILEWACPCAFHNISSSCFVTVFVLRGLPSPLCCINKRDWAFLQIVYEAWQSYKNIINHQFGFYSDRSCGMLYSTWKVKHYGDVYCIWVPESLYNTFGYYYISKFSGFIG